MDPSLLGRPAPAPIAQKPQGLMTKKTFFILLGFVLALIGGLLMLGASGDKSGPLQQRLSARQATTLKLIADGQKNLSDDDLTKLNSELGLILNGDTATLKTAYSSTAMKKIDETITASEADTETFEKLATAKINGQYNDVYRGVIIQKLESLQALLKELHGATRSKALKTAVATEHKHVSGYLEILNKLD